VRTRYSGASTVRPATLFDLTRDSRRPCHLAPPHHRGPEPWHRAPGHGDSHGPGCRGGPARMGCWSRFIPHRIARFLTARRASIRNSSTNDAGDPAHCRRNRTTDRGAR
jgi:hypothetical protein